MAKKTPKLSGPNPKPAEPPKVPFPVSDKGAFIQKSFVACNIVSVPTFECVAYSIAYDRIEVVNIPVSEMGADHETHSRYYANGFHVDGGPAQLAKTHLGWLRSKALESGATPDAIRLLSAVTGKFTEKEMKNMAEKLKSKTTAPKKADAKALKTAAKSTPVGGAKKRGNADALKKARESKGPDTRKIKALVKAKDLKAREGTSRRKMLEDLLTSKTVQEFREKGYSAGDLNYAIGADIISVA